MILARIATVPLVIVLGVAALTACAETPPSAVEVERRDIMQQAVEEFSPAIPGDVLCEIFGGNTLVAEGLSHDLIVSDTRSWAPVTAKLSQLGYTLDYGRMDVDDPDASDPTDPPRVGYSRSGRTEVAVWVTYLADAEAMTEYEKRYSTSVPDGCGVPLEGALWIHVTDAGTSTPQPIAP